MSNVTSPTELTSPVTNQPKLLKLISVSFKEAALDSPTFRASVNHMNSLVGHTEQWLDGLLKFIKKYPQYYADFRDFLYTSVDLLSPGFLADGIVDQDYTLSALQYTKTGISGLWNESLRSFRIDDTDMIALLSQAKADIKQYKETRKQFEVAQTKYDLFLSRYAALSKTKEPSSLREDAFQLSDVRRQYIHMSLELCIAQSGVQKALDAALVGLAACFWGDADTKPANPAVLVLWTQFQKIKSWASACDASLRILSRDMVTARHQIEESAMQQFAPSRDLSQHNPALITAASLADLKEPVYEKHGWVFMKTSVGKPARQIWLRRWAFVKSGMFGLLNLSPSKTWVQESDKIGVLLCNVRYAASEDRRFCFEIKTIDTSIVLQAETVNELKHWLKVFATEKKRALDASPQASSPPFMRFPPPVTEFASTATTSCDAELTSSVVENRGNAVVVSKSLAHLVNSLNKSYNPEFAGFLPESSTADDLSFPRDGVLEEPVLNTPIATRLTKMAVAANAFFTASSVPSATNANIWGTINWGLYYLVSAPSSSSAGMDLRVPAELVDDPDKFSSSLYPTYFSKQMINADVYMKAIFGSALRTPLQCMLSFRCIWSPNSKQELSGRCFVTLDTMYFYMNSMGFVSLLTKDLDNLISVETVSRKSWDTLKVYAIDGLNLRAKVFLDDARKIAQKLEVLINNRTAVAPLDATELAAKLREIDAADLEPTTSVPAGAGAAGAAVAATTNQAPKAAPAKLPIAPATETAPQDIMPSLHSIGAPHKIDFFEDYDRLLCDTEVKIPAKALFHVIFGDSSTVFKEALTMINGDGYISKPWKTIPENKLQRKVVFKLSTNSKNALLKDKRLLDTKYNGIVLGTMSEVHTINELVDDEYYDVSTERSKLQLPLGVPFSVQTRIVIWACDQDSCRLRIFQAIRFTRRSTTNLAVANVYKSVFVNEARKMVTKINECVEQIGEYGKTNKAIKLYGQLGMAQGKDDSGYSADEGTITFGFLLFVKLLLRVTALRGISGAIWLCGMILSGIGRIFMSLSTHRLLVLMLILSGLGNIWLSGRATNSFWVAKRTEKMLNDYTKIAYDSITSRDSAPQGLMARAIYLRDIIEMVEQGQNGLLKSRDSKCFKEFLNASFVVNYEKVAVERSFLNKQYGQLASFEVARNLQRTLQDIGIRRNELLIDLKILERMEHEIALGEWKNWLTSENYRCDFVKSEIVDKVNDEKVLPGVEELMSYCDSCKNELESSYLL